MGIIAELDATRRINENRILGELLHTYVIAPRHHMAYTLELVEHLAKYPLRSVETGEPCGPATYAEVEAAIKAGKCELGGIQIRYAGDRDELDMPMIPLHQHTDNQVKVRYTDPMPPCVLALQSVVEANARYVELTGRPQEAVALHPAHARELLDLILNK